LVSHYVTRLVLNSQAQEKPPTLASWVSETTAHAAKPS
jgi:hypothetical protein